MKHLPYIAAIIGISLFIGGASANAQNATLQTTEATSTQEQPKPNPFPLSPIFTPEPAASSSSALSTTTATSAEEVLLPPAQPIIKETPTEQPLPKATPKNSTKPAAKPLVKETPKEELATTTATSTATTTDDFVPLAPGTILPGNIYRDTIHAPLTIETTLYLLALAVLSLVLGILMVEKNRLDNFGTLVSTFFSPLRSLPRHRTQRQ
jgi:hypothetical protein